MSDDQVTLFDFVPTPADSTPAPSPSLSVPELISMSSAKDSFGCCSHYRECSEEGHCVIADRDYSVNCTYRRHLADGQIFYGKQSTFFEREKYETFLNRVDTLSSEAKKSFNDLIIVFSEYCRGTATYIVRNQYINELSSVGLFDFHPLGLNFSKRCAYRALKPIIANAPECPAFESAQKKRKAELQPLRDALKLATEKKNIAEMKRLKEAMKPLPGENTNEFLTHWLDEEAPDLRDRLAEPYRIAERKEDAIQYIFEYYHDFIVNFGYDDRIYSLSPMAEDRLVPDGDLLTEEIRRVKLSRGYSSEEKSRRLALLAEIQSTKNADEKEQLSRSYNF